MNILVPDSWLREYLQTQATPKQIKEYLSLCGPSIERINTAGNQQIYDIEITGNRPDAMSVIGVAREAAAILPRFGIKAQLTGNPYLAKLPTPTISKPRLKLAVKTDSALNPRWTSVVFDDVTIKESPAWLKARLESVGIRSLNVVIDITNYLMHAFGQPAHVFDYDTIKGAKMTLRAAKKGEHITTLDGKTHTLPGGDIVISDGSGKLIDLCGIMGGESSRVVTTTKRVILFVQTYDPMHIRSTSMALAHRTQAAGLFEKRTDPELVWPVFLQGVRLMRELTGGKIASKITDLYPKRYTPVTVSLPRKKLNSYMGAALSDRDIKTTLTTLGFTPHLTKSEIHVTVPSSRADVRLDVDVIEEIARIYGYHRITARLPVGAPPITLPDASLRWEEEIKIRLRDWGFTETYTYSMISEALMDVFHLDKTKTYKISNPLSEEWVYLRPHLLPSVLTVLRQNLHLKKTLKTFELSMIYRYRTGELPEEIPTLVVVMTGHAFAQMKGLAEALFDLFGIPVPLDGECPEPFEWYSAKHLNFDYFGTVGEVSNELLEAMGIPVPVTILDLDIHTLITQAQAAKKYVLIPKYPPSYEDITFIVKPGVYIGPFMTELQSVDPLVADVSLLDTYENTRTIHVTYQNPKGNLTSDDVKPIHDKIITLASEKFGAVLQIPTGEKA